MNFIEKTYKKTFWLVFAIVFIAVTVFIGKTVYDNILTKEGIALEGYKQKFITKAFPFHV